MSHIIAVSPSGIEVIVDSFVKNPSKALKYWAKYGMSNCKYYAKKLSKADTFKLEHG